MYIDNAKKIYVTKNQREFSKFGLHTSTYEKFSSAWLLFYANLQQYKLLNIHI